MSVTRISAGDARRARLASLLLADRAVRTPGEIVEWFGAMQAQDLASGEWSFGMRSAGLTQRDVQAATEERQIVRTWPMRGTVHFVPPRDAHWMLEVTGVRALAGAERRRANIGLEDADVSKALDVLSAALSEHGQLTRGACTELLQAAGVHRTSQHGYHLLWYASQKGLTCIGPQLDGEQTFVLLDEWVPNPHKPDRDEALVVLARRFFRSHGPARVTDLAGWTGLNLGDTKRAIAALGDEVVAVELDGAELLVTPAALEAAAVPAADRDVLLVASFDEFLLGFKERSLVLDPVHAPTVIPGNNGIFMYTVVHRGQVIATWKRNVKKRSVDVRVAPFAELTKTQRAGLERAAADYGAYLGFEQANVVI